MALASSPDFNELLQQAVALKSARTATERKKFNAYPKHIQHSLFHPEDSKGKQTDTLEEKLKVAEQYKAEGNCHFEKGEFLIAIDSYEKALGCFEYLTSSNKEWQTQGIKDSELTLHEHFRDNFHVKKIQSSCLCNIAACYLMLGPSMSKECIAACDEALHIDSKASKAYYRRAQARMLPASSGPTDLELSIEDLKAAAKIKPQSKEIRSFLDRLVNEKRNQQAKESRTFKGLFQRGDLGFESTEEKSSDQNVVKDRQDQVDLLVRMSKSYKMQGRTKEAEELLEAAHKILDTETSEVNNIDWDNPPESIIHDAASKGIDLKNASVRAEMKKIAKESENFDEQRSYFNYQRCLLLLSLVVLVVSSCYAILYGI